MKISRRSLIRTTLAAASGMMISRESRPVEKAMSKPKPDIKIGIAAYSFRKYLPQGDKKGEITLHDLCDMAAGWNLDAIEPTSYYFSSEDLVYVHSLKAKAFRLGLDISGMPIRSNFCLPSGGKLDEQMAHVNKWIDIAAALGAPCIRIFAGSKNDPRKDFGWMADGMKRACDYAGSKGVFLAIENHGYLTGTASDLERILETVDHEWLGVNLDTGNFVEKPYENMAAIAAKAVAVQVKIKLRTYDGKDKEDADFGRIVDILRGANYRGCAALEYEGEEDPMTAVPKHLEALRNAIALRQT